MFSQYINMIRQRIFWHSISMIPLITMFIFWMSSTEAQILSPALPLSVVAAIDPGIEYAPGLLIVKLKPGIQLVAKRDVTAANVAVSTNNPGLDQILLSIGILDAVPVFTTESERIGRTVSGDNFLTRVYRLQLAPDADVATAVKLLQHNDGIEYAEPDYIARAALTPDDPEWSNQWAPSKINAPIAWDNTQGTNTTVIALIDSGIDLTHLDLNGRLWQNDDIPGNGVDDDQNGKIDDVNGWNFVEESNNVAATNEHGTQVAGVAGAGGNNGLGVAGLCWQCRLMPVVAMQANGVANYSTIANAVAYAASNGAAVINLSLGGYADSNLLREAIRDAATTSVIVAAVGNDDSSTPFYPAAYPDVIAVAATDITDQKTIFSNYGPWVDIAAPGSDILTTTPGGYAPSSGTSVATPFVSGVAGLLKSLHPDWSPTLIAWQILNTATSIDGINPTYASQLGHGRLDAGMALTQTPQAHAQVEGYSVDGQSNGRPAPSQSFQLVLALRNTWMLGENLIGALVTTDSYITITDNQGIFGNIDTGQSGTNANDPFIVTLQPDTPYNHTLIFSLNLTGANGYVTSIPFSLQVRTALETLGNTQYTQNTTWTSDKTYILNGTVIVGSGITLTIQPGTVVKGNSGKFMRIDGTLIAQGTEQSPITFTTNAANKDKWGGLRFADTAVSASLDVNGNYVAGSILRYVTISHATAGVNLGTQAPYIANSTFHDNDTGIQSNSDAPRIEKNIFRENVTAISLMSGYPIIYGNYFTRNKNRTMGSAIDGNGSPQILSNTFIDEQGYHIIRLASGNPMLVNSLVVRGNRIVSNSGGLVISGMQIVEIEDNLIANNHGFCQSPPCLSTGFSVLSLHLQSLGSLAVNNNTIINNNGYGLWLQGSGTNSVTVANNNLFGNGDYDLYLQSGSPGAQNFIINATNNFWDVEASTIAGRIHDCTFDENGCGSSSSTLGKVHYSPYLAEPIQNAPAFIHRVTMDPDPIGLNQLGIITVNFSRPMITETLPIVTFHDARRGTIMEQVSSNLVRDITQDAIGRIWFGMGEGANMFDGRQWYTYTTANSGLGNNNTNVIYGADNGDIWFGGVSMLQEEAPLSQLQGSTWITYNQIPNMNQGPISAISQDAVGNTWVGAGERGVFRFDGISWQKFTTTDGLSSNYIRQIIRDTQGQMWFMTGTGATENDPGGLDVFDGIRWQTYNRATGMPTNVFTLLFADSQGRVWAGMGSAINRQYYVAMFDGIIWHFFGPGETDGHLACTVFHFSEAPDGTIWMHSCYGTVTYQDGIWKNETNTIAGILIDNKGNFWYDNMRVRWGGLDYHFEEGKWISPTRYQSTYNFTALIPQGLYTVDISGARSTDGIEAISGTTDTFRVDFGMAANPAPPLIPAVAAENNGTLTTISASWRTDSSDIDQYRYAIGTTPGARNVVGWTYLTTTTMVRSDLVLFQGQSYYVSTQARNKFGLWSVTGVSNQVIAGVVTTPPTPINPTPGGPTVTPSSGTPTLTPTPTITPVLSQKLDAVGDSVGAPGSRFIFTGSTFPPNTQLSVSVTPLFSVVAAGSLVIVGIVTTDAIGNFSLTLLTDTYLSPGRYRLAVGDNPQASAEFEVNATATLLQPPIMGVAITMPKQIYLPIIRR